MEKPRLVTRGLNATRYRQQALNNAKARAKKRRVTFSLTLDNLPLIPPTCPVLGLPLGISRGKQGPSPKSPSLDCIIPEYGYHPDNVIWVSSRANSIKQNVDPEELRKVARFYETLYRTHFRAALAQEKT